MLLCAGYGSRLAALGGELPKPMLPVCNLAILRYGVALLAGHGIRDIVINLHHRGDVIEEEFGDGADHGVRIEYTHEGILLGTGGGLKHALRKLDPDGLDEPFLSMNGKLILDLDISAVLASARADATAGAIGTMVVRRVSDATSWGAVQVQPEPGGRLLVRDILGEGDHMFCGVHVTRPSVVRRLPDGEACMVRQGYLPWIRAGATVGAFVAGDGYFAEHSTPARYLDSNLALLRGATLRFPPAPMLRGVNPSAHIAPSALLRKVRQVLDTPPKGPR
jgi:NDP-sugar pyrophosphorylase family protein